MFSKKRRLACLVTSVLAVVSLAGCADGGAGKSGALQVSGSTTVAPVAADAAEALKADGLDITVATQGGSAGGISQLASGQITIALSSKPLSEEDKAANPDTDFVSTQIGADAVGIIVTKQVADAGVKNLTADQVRDLFEGKIKNWSEVGGPDLDVFVYDKEPGRGTREVLDKYIYGDEKAPPPPESGNFAIVGGNLETRNKLESTPGAVAPLSTSFVEGRDRLAAVTLDGIEASPENIATGKYPMSRPLYLITDGKPEGTAKKFIDYVLSAKGQALMTKHDYLTLKEIGK
ncbi:MULTISPECIES: phosphate ABC transporter substrate-binding protein [Streptomyces]|uniref:ABC transporter binding lipoprotein n=1 Tax=Streptomyces coelicolor (strain ATCC BAA-471 / A3(2) / M145) TaxID=100226 RepID=Q9L216_STRCO|nr:MULTISPECIES: phosphate ABC transporter substrate-binding protein [Streptomyces]MDX2930370.1 phosphate ABC transporter substrate-binding protein [Streptomyces sp. NRRL_B-16638]MDX3408837.1 phosphate ABC transporter substrate-binding protein [Streptomyces sp. ME02-6977A]MYU46321.1 phosphate ABC transporter substrate-binding protein [Streptomyces sp. SID7813]NSL78266.1 phosphate ABC transporter substrate-binding protein [Streptomyces coelicolor]QFI46597.1 phosphate ABC transporter substrate-b